MVYQPARAWENYGFVLVTDLAGRAGIIDALPIDDVNQPHRPGGAMIIGPNAEILCHTQSEQIRDEMIVQDLRAADLKAMRGHENCHLRTRRVNLFRDLV